MYAAFLLSSILYAHICSSKVEDQISLNAEIARATKRLSFEDVLSGSLRPEFTNLQWTSTGKDGSYFETNQTTGDLWLAHVLDDERQLLVNGSELQSLIREKIVDRHVSIHEHKLQPGGTKVLVSTNHTKLYRWSGFADLYVYDPSTGSIYVLDEDQASDIRYARWSPTGDSIAYVRHNNLYINQDGKNIKITNDGSADIFNGVPDWVYEEEIFASTNTMWYSPDGRYIAFLKFNDTGVPIYRVPYYMTGQKATAYPRELELKYPKAGQVIPTVSLHLVDLDNIDKGPQDLDSDSFAPEDLVIGEVTWITDNHSHLAWRCLNRIQDHDELIILDVLNKTTFIATERTEPKGWIDNVQSIRYLPGMNCFVYLSDKDGWSHIFLHYLNGTDSLQLTKGKWEVTQILYVNSDTVFYQSTERDSTERHIYSLDLNSLRKTALVDDTVPGVYRASFSSEGGYYILSYLGPKLPRQALYSVQDSTKAIRVLQNNSVLFEKLSKYNLPQSRWTTIKHPDGFELNVLETLPPDFDVKRSYPLLLNPYGGPGSQQTAKTYHGADWWAYIASDPSLEYVVLTVDGRGTGFKGNTFGHTVTGKLGHYEALDQVFAAETWRRKSYIDASKIVIQGWSYGGYLSSKVIELNTDVFSSAIITAPVSSWLFYDALYTERYMKSPQNNSEGYYKSSVHNTTGFSCVRGGVLLQHGTGDDNVHFQNSAVLVDLLMTGGVASVGTNSTTSTIALNFDQNIIDSKFDQDPGFHIHEEGVVVWERQQNSQDSTPSLDIQSASQKPVSPSKLTVQWFTDSDHGISFHGSTLFLRKQMARWLYREKRRKEQDIAAEIEEEELWLSKL